MPEPTRLARTSTGVPGLDNVCGGGLPTGEVTLLAGAPGTGKSVLGTQFLAAGAVAGEPGVLVTFDEQPQKARRFTSAFGWDIDAWESDGRWAFLDASPDGSREIVTGPDVDLTLLIARIADAVGRLGAKRVVLDAISDVLNRIGDGAHVRAELHRLVLSLEELGVTTLAIAERDHETPIARLGVEEFVADNVVILRNRLELGSRRRTVEALKLRGTQHLMGEFPFAILPEQGLVLAALHELELTEPSSGDRLSLGNPDLDAMCGGGALAGSVVLVSGPAGSGRSLLGVEFAAAAARDGGCSLLVSFEESPDRLARNARAWGHDLDRMQQEGQLRLLCQYPESAPAPAHLIRIQHEVDELRPTRLVLDSLWGLERTSPPKVFDEFLLGLTAMLKRRGITAILTTTTPWLVGGTAATGAETSPLIDSVILLRYLEAEGRLRRGISVLKWRGSSHTSAIREFSISGRGLQLAGPFQSGTGVLSGRVDHRGP